MRVLRALVVLAALAPVAPGQEFAQWSDERKERFLRDAEVVGSKRVSRGVTGTMKLTLADGETTHDASWQTVDEFAPQKSTPAGLQLNFRDSFRYNVAAYRLDRLLGLGMVPVSVERKYRGDRGALTWWVDDVLMLELERYTKKIEPPDKDAWNDQLFQARIFNELVYNTDPNLGNVLITRDWQVRLIDFTRAFRTLRALRKPKNVEEPRIDRAFWTALRSLTAEDLDRAMGPMLLKTEKRGLLARRDRLVEHIEDEIASRGEEAVIFDLRREAKR